jgi:hypothetical protein
MRTTFEELLGKGNKFHYETVYTKTHVLKILELVRQKTLEECVESAKVDFVLFNYGDSCPNLDGLTPYLLEESILNLPKDSIKYNKEL